MVMARCCRKGKHTNVKNNLSLPHSTSKTVKHNKRRSVHHFPHAPEDMHRGMQQALFGAYRQIHVGLPIEQHGNGSSNDECAKSICTSWRSARMSSAEWWAFEAVAPGFKLRGVYRLLGYNAVVALTVIFPTQSVSSCRSAAATTEDDV